MPFILLRMYVFSYVLESVFPLFWYFAWKPKRFQTTVSFSNISFPLKSLPIFLGKGNINNNLFLSFLLLFDCTPSRFWQFREHLQKLAACVCFDEVDILECLEEKCTAGRVCRKVLWTLSQLPFSNVSYCTLLQNICPRDMGHFPRLLLSLTIISICTMQISQDKRHVDASRGRTTQIGWTRHVWEHPRLLFSFRLESSSVLSRDGSGLFRQENVGRRGS